MNPTLNNVRTNLVGDGNRYKVSNTAGGDLQVSDSTMSIRNSTLIRLNGNQHHAHLGNCSNIFVSGSENALSLNNTINGKVNGERNTVYLNNLSNFDLIGHDNVCELKDETSSQRFQISGNENRILGSGNRNFTVCGNENFVNAQISGNLRIQASQSRIVTYCSDNITVNGDRNEIGLWNTELKQRLMRDITGSANLVSITTHNIEKPYRFQDPNVGGLDMFRSQEIPNTERWLCQGQSYMPITMAFRLELMHSSTTKHIPYLDISYIDRISINQKNYVLGIFYFTVEYLKRDTDDDYTSFLGIRVNLNVLDENSFTSARMSGEMEDRINITGRKNGILQTIRLGGPQIMSCENGNQFIVNLNPSAAVQE